MLFLNELRHSIKNYGKENIVYFDESGFEDETIRLSGWASRGKRIKGDVSGTGKRRRTNLIMAQRRGKWLAPMLFKLSCNSKVVITWIESMLLPELIKPSVIIMDNAAFHKKSEIQELLHEHGHKLLPLPPYSPDFNPIEQSFAIIKKRRLSTQPSEPLEKLLM